VLRQTGSARDNPPVPEAIVRRRLIVHGSVQGVFFRDATRRTAEEHGVSGWVRNRADGTVEAILEGPRDAVWTVEQFCRVGPDHAQVQRVEASNEDPEGISGFRVR
jgi:acylphosphatase